MACAGTQDARDDWAVVKLAKPVDDVIPYNVDYTKVLSVKVGTAVITVGHSFDIFRSAKNTGSGAKHIGRCSLGNVDLDAEPYYMSGPCGCAPGCSGGTLLADDNTRSLLGITISSGRHNFDFMRKEAEAIPGRPNLFHYSDIDSATYYVPIAGHFLTALEDATGVKLK